MYRKNRKFITILRDGKTIVPDEFSKDYFEPMYKIGEKRMINIPDSYKEGHEAHFGRVTEKSLEYLANHNMPAWEVPNMIAKYYTTTRALEIAKAKENTVASR